MAHELIYESVNVGVAYGKLSMAEGPVYFPDVCCDCLQPTDIRYTVRGNRLRHRDLAGIVVAGAMGTNDYFEMKVPVCNRCWRAYLKRRQSWFWLGPFAGAALMLAFPSLLIFQGGKAFSEGWPACGILLFAGLIGGMFASSRMADWFAKPPAIVRLNRYFCRITIRFRNPAYIEPFLAAQAEVPQPGQREAAAPVSPAWFYLQDGNTVGPFSFQEIKRMVAEGELQPQTMVWTESQPDWLWAEKVPGLFKA